MEDKKQKIEFSTGRMEFIAVKDEIKRLCDSGISKTRIYKQMYESGKFTMHYNTFCYHLRKMNEAKQQYNDKSQQNKGVNTNSQAERQPQVARQDTRTGPRIVNSTKEPFPDPRNMSVEDGI